MFIEEDEEEDSEAEADLEPNNDIEDDEEEPDDEEETDYNYRRRQLVKLAATHNPTCDRCVRGKRKCHKEAGGGAGYSCVVLKSKCIYSKSGRKEVSDRDVKVKRENTTKEQGDQ
jgi:hypothetical protein